MEELIDEKWLLNPNININITAKGRKTVLIVAVEIENREITKDLLKRDPDIERKDQKQHWTMC